MSLWARRVGRAMAVALCLLLSGAAPAARVPAQPPIFAGRLDYRVSWNGIPAGNATVNVARVEDGVVPQYRVEASAQTNAVVDLLWSLRARVSASFTTTDLTPLGFRYDREMNRVHSRTDIVYDPVSQRPTGIHVTRGRTTTHSPTDPTVTDPVTAIFRALSEPIRLGDTFHYEVFTGESLYRVELRVVGADTLTVAAGTFRAWRVEPRVWKVGPRVDRRLRRATLWVSQEPVRAVLRIRSQLFIGAVYCDLQQLQT
jgi:hypothetical protein